MSKYNPANSLNRLAIFLSFGIIFVLNSIAQKNADSTGFKTLSSEALRAVTALFTIDHSIPLDVNVVEKYETRTYTHEKIVFTGVRGDRVPGYLAIPKNGSGPHPIVFLFHISAGSKSSWWDEMSFERGQTVTDTLLELGFAVLALDAQFHGERSMNGDYVPIQQMYVEKKWVNRYRDGIIQTIGDYQRAVDYLSTRKEIDIQRIGALGHSLGGVMAVLFSTVEKKVIALVASVAAYSDAWLYPLTPFNVAENIRTPTLLLGGKQDIVVSPAAVKKLFSVIKSSNKEIEIYDSGHRLPAENITKSVLWLKKYLGKK